MIGLSPLPTGHPSGFQPTPVRASTRCYPSFTLPMGRSPWLRVCARELQNALVPGLAFAAPPGETPLSSLASSNSPDHNAKGTRSAVNEARAPPQPPTACGHVVSGTLSLPAQGCFSPVPHGTRPLSVTREYSRLGGWSPRLHARFLESGATQEHRYRGSVAFRYRALTVSGAPSQGTSRDFSPRVRGSFNPGWTSHPV